MMPPRPAQRNRVTPKRCGLLAGSFAVLALGSLCAIGPAHADVDDVLRRPGRAHAEPTHQLDVPRPVGIAYSNRTGAFLLIGAPAKGRLAGNTAMVSTTVFRDTVGSFALPISLTEQVQIVYDEERGRLLLYDAPRNAFYEMIEGADGQFDPSRSRALPAPTLGLVRVAGMTLDPATGAIYLLDRLTRRIARIVLPANDTRDRFVIVEPIWTTIDFQVEGELRGLARHPVSGHMFVVGGDRLYELSNEGSVVAAFELSELPIVAPKAMVFAPSADQTDSSSSLGLFIVDPGDSLAGTPGHMFEVSLEAPIPSPIAPSLLAGELVRTIEAFRWSPPSPDPSGIAYDPIHDRLLISDGEVDEVRIWANVNYFESSRTGQLLRGSDLTPFTHEPTGVAFDRGGRLFFSDDDARRIFVVQLGANLQFDPSDPVTSFSTRDFGSGDPEGVSYDEAGDRLFVADGVNNEVYEIHPGGDRAFGTSDDVVTSFDTGSVGISDPETVEFHPASGTLFLIGSHRIVEVTTGGSLVAEIDIGSVPISKPAGMTIAPNSNDPSALSFYMVDRAVDNCSNSSENDGKVFEAVFGNGGSGPPGPAGPDYRITSGANDAEQSSSGSVTSTSSDLDLESGYTTGLRFTDVAVPQGAVITTAWIQFKADESQSGATSLILRGEAADDAAPLASSSGNLTSRAPTAASVPWDVTPWTAGDRGDAQRSPELKRIVQEIVDRLGWASGHAMVFTIAGTGKRTAESYEGDASGAAVLHVEYEVENRAPAVDAGGDRTVVLGIPVDLGGIVHDEGLPEGSIVSIEWMQVSGPAAVVFDDETDPGTQATFPLLGTYRLRLWASDGTLEASDSIVVEVIPEPMLVARRITSGSDDVEQSGASMTLTSSDLDLETGSLVGLRFLDIALEREAPIVSAHLQFTADESQSGTTALTIRGIAENDAAAFTSSSNHLSQRATTGAAVTWDPAAWTVGDSSGAQKSPDLSSIVSEIVARAGWASGHAMGFVISGSGKRTAESFEAGSGVAARLIIEFGEAANQPPLVNAGPDEAIDQGTLADLHGTVSDDGKPAGSPLTTRWRLVSGPFACAFEDSTALDTRASFADSGRYVLRLVVSDGELTASDTVQITVLRNTAPSADAGPDQDITLPSGTTLTGSADDDGLPLGSTLAVAWRFVDGPAAPSFADSNAAATAASFAAPGTYTLAFDASDGALTTRAVMTIVVHPKPNEPPRVAAGDDQVITSPDRAILAGQVSDDDLPAGGTLVTVWRQVSGPATAAFADSNALDTEVELPAAGLYALLLEARDGELIARDTLRIEVRPNQAPEVDAGPDQEIVLPSHAALDGTVSDATIPSGAALTTAWRFVSGPAEPTFADSNAVDTDVSFAVDGTYLLSLNATDGDLSAADQITVVVRPVPPNQPPLVAAGADQELDGPGSALLEGSASDDGLPFGSSLVTAWRQVEGPTAVAFADSNALRTSVSFPDSGTYVLSLHASDGEASNSDSLTVVVHGLVVVTDVIDVRVIRSSDDAEERDGGSVSLTSSDIELVNDGSTHQIIGLRFDAVAIPRGAKINHAHVQFQVDEADVGTTNLTIQGERSGHASTFTGSNGNVSGRPRTVAAKPWSPSPWTQVGVFGAEQRTPELAEIIEEIVGGSTWTEGNALALIISGSGERTAEAYDGDAAGAALLHVEFERTIVPPPPPVNQPPTVEAGPDQTVVLPAVAQLAGSASDDDLPATGLTTTWSLAEGPANPTWTDPDALDARASFPIAGTYVLRLTADDGALATSDSMSVEVLAAGSNPTSFERQVGASEDDAEERLTGSMSLTSSDLELTTDNSTVQIVGIRFRNVTIPRGAQIVSAYVQFQVDEAKSGNAPLQVHGQLGDAAAFTSASGNVSSRPRTTGSIDWSPPDWTVVGQAGPDQRTPDLSSLIQEIVSRGDWTSGNALGLFVTGTGVRTAEAFDGDASGAPRLHVEYR